MCTHEREIDDAFVKRSYVSATRFLRRNYSYMLRGPKGSTASLLISTWSKTVRRSEVLKYDILQYIVKLEPSNPKNNPRRSYLREISGCPQEKKEGSLAGV